MDIMMEKIPQQLMKNKISTENNNLFRRGEEDRPPDTGFKSGGVAWLTPYYLPQVRRYPVS